MGKTMQGVEEADESGVQKQPGHHSQPCRRPPGRKPGPSPEFNNLGRRLKEVTAHCFPDINDWFNSLPDPRKQEMCTYTASHIWWQPIMGFLVRSDSRNAFDASRNSGMGPQNHLLLCGQQWDSDRLGERRTVTCSENVVYHTSRVPEEAVAQIPIMMAKRLMNMRLLEKGRLFDSWWMVIVDGTLQDRGRKTRKKQARYRYVLEAKLVAPEGVMIHLLTEFSDIHNLVTDKEDCELNAFLRMAKRLRAAFPRLSICLVMDGLYAVKPVFDVCRQYEWKFIATLREGRQPTAWAEAVHCLLGDPGSVVHSSREGEDGHIEQTVRWTEPIPFGEHNFQVLFAGEIGQTCATLWCWVTNFRVDHDRAAALANNGGRIRGNIEVEFNVEKNGGFGLEHAFCAGTVASRTYHLSMQIGRTIWQLFVDGYLRRLLKSCRKLCDIEIADLLRTSWLTSIGDPAIRPIGQLRFSSS